MPLKIIRQDITKVKCDAIVNAANPQLCGGGGVDGAIHKAAGPMLLKECMTLGGCDVGKAKVTKGYDLPAKYVIHTVGPIWHGGTQGERELLISCYRNSLKIASDIGCQSVAFPLISAGVYGYPKKEAFKIAVDTIIDFLSNSDMLVYIIMFDKEISTIGSNMFSSISSYIDDTYVDEHSDASYGIMRNINVCASYDLSSAVSQIDESFSEMLLRKIDELGMTDTECYKRANIDRKLFSKIRSNKNYRPSKQTAIAFCIALKLPLNEMNDMLRKAGFALSHSNKFDIIIEYFVKSENYNIFEINEALFEFDQQLLC